VIDAEISTAVELARPRLGFLGVGWIGRNRMEAMLKSRLAEVVALADPAPEARQAAAALAPEAEAMESLEALLDTDLDALVIATPSALHAQQAIAAMERGLAVFCQKPLGRDGAETAQVVCAAENADVLLGVDLSYRHTVAGRAVRDLVAAGALGEVYAVDLVFHNAYGPDKPWFYDRRLAGGGCLVDLGIHLVDLALWCLDFPDVRVEAARMFSRGGPVGDGVEDFVNAQLSLGSVSARLSCSWGLPAGRDAVIEATFHGTAGGATLRNVNGSFYDFVAEHMIGTRCQALVRPPDAWGGRAAMDWLVRLCAGGRFDPEAHRFEQAAFVLDDIYAAAGHRG
jgi:predicted dehydrogenase